MIHAVGIVRHVGMGRGNDIAVRVTEADGRGRTDPARQHGARKGRETRIGHQRLDIDDPLVLRVARHGQDGDAFGQATRENLSGRRRRHQSLGHEDLPGIQPVAAIEQANPDPVQLGSRDQSETAGAVAVENGVNPVPAQPVRIVATADPAPLASARCREDEIRIGFRLCLQALLLVRPEVTCHSQSPVANR